jgi:amino acid transporter
MAIRARATQQRKPPESADTQRQARALRQNAAPGRVPASDFLLLWRLSGLRPRRARTRLEVSVSDLDVTSRPDVQKLEGKAIGLVGVLFLTVTGAAPISAMLFNVPIGVGNGNGLGVPAAFLVATVILLVFSIGYAAMAKKVTAVGGFYAFISRGLGRPAGLALGFGSVVAYCVFEVSLAGGFAYFANQRFPSVPWPVFSFGMIAAIAALSFFEVKLSTVVLGVALVGEVIILVIFDIGVFTHAGNGATVNLAALSPMAAFRGFPEHNGLAGGVAAIGLFFAFWSWIGFEMAPNYGEESRDPKRNVPLSLYISVLGLGVFYVITSWAAVSAYPTTDAAITQAQKASSEFFLAPTAQFVGNWAREAMSWLILTSAFACGMAFHNTAARYFYSLGREGVLPAALGRTHPKHKSPYVGSFTQSAFAALIILAFCVFMGTDDANKQAYLGVYGLMALVGTSLIMFAQAVVSLAIVMYFRAHHREEQHWFKTVVAPLLAFVAQIYVLWLLFSNIGFLGSNLAFTRYILWIDLGVVLIGFAGAFWLKRARPKIYDQLGHMMYEGLD